MEHNSHGCLNHFAKTTYCIESWTECWFGANFETCNLSASDDIYVRDLSTLKILQEETDTKNSSNVVQCSRKVSICISVDTSLYGCFTVLVLDKRIIATIIKKSVQLNPDLLLTNILSLATPLHVRTWRGLGVRNPSNWKIQIYTHVVNRPRTPPPWKTLMSIGLRCPRDTFRGPLPRKNILDPRMNCNWLQSN